MHPLVEGGKVAVSGVGPYDPEEVAALFAEDVEYRYHPYDEPIVGRDAVVASWLGEGSEETVAFRVWPPVAIGVPPARRLVGHAGCGCSAGTRPGCCRGRRRTR